MATVAAVDPLAYADDHQRLEALQSLGVLDTPPDPALDIICRLAADRFRVPIALVSLIDGHRQWFKARYGLALSETPRRDSLCMHAMTSRDIMVVSDTQNDVRFAANPLVREYPHARFYAGAPLVLASGHCIGALCILDHRPRKILSQRDRDALELMARQVIDNLESHCARQEQIVSELIARTTSDAFVCSDENGRIVLWNRAAQEMLGWAAEEALGQDADQFLRLYRPGGETAWSLLASDQGVKSSAAALQLDIGRKDGHSVPVELSIATWSSGNGDGSSAVAGILRDVSERKYAEARLAEQVSALDASNDGIALTNSEGIFVFMNRAHARMFGYECPDQLLGCKWSILYPEKEVDRLDREIMPLLSVEGQWRGQTRGKKADGTVVEQEVTLSLSDEGRIVCITRDISQRLALEREKAILAETLMLRQRQEVVGQLASGIAHDFNNIINVISGTTLMLETHAEKAVRDHVARIQSAATMASRMVEKLLALGRRRQATEQVNLCRVARDISDLLHPSLKDPRHELVVVLPPRPIWSHCDEAEVTQLIMNLLVNARDALPVGQAGQITLEVMEADGRRPSDPVAIGRDPRVPAALIKVSDNGRGIPEEISGRIFEPFFSGKGDGGTGLGLAVVANIIDANGGAISVKSTPGVGAVFEIWWPVDAMAQTNCSPVKDAPTDLLDLSGKAVMVVDDNQPAVEIVTHILEAMMAEVGSCLDPAAALAVLEEGADDWDLIITDYDMPGMNGYDLAQAARTIREDIPILLLTGLQPSEGLPSFRLSVFDGVLGKPASPGKLREAVSEAISAAEARRS